MDKVKFIRAHRIIVGVVIASLLLIIVFLTYTIATATETTKSKRWIAKHPLLSKRLAVEGQNDILINFAPLRDALKLYFSRLKADHSFYFEYLPTGTSVQIGESTELVSASLLKVPLVMDLYKAVELGSTSLDKKVTIGKKNIDPLFGNLWKKGAGTKMTLQEAVRYTLVDSDNTAASIIRDEVERSIDPLKGSYNELDIPLSNIDQKVSVISAKAYSSILKCLYLSCFLSPEDSQEILKYLSESNDQRIRGGVPPNVTVANKIGTFSTRVQSDCGIVYAPNRPFLVCMMVALPEEQADPHIRTVTNMIYSYISDIDR